MGDTFQPLFLFLSALLFGLYFVLCFRKVHIYVHITFILAAIGFLMIFYWNMVEVNIFFGPAAMGLAVLQLKRFKPFPTSFRYLLLSFLLGGISTTCAVLKLLNFSF